MYFSQSIVVEQQIQQRMFKHISLAFFFLFAILADTTAQVTITPWEMHQGEGKIAFRNSRNGDPAAYQKMKIPASNDAGWQLNQLRDGKVFLQELSAGW
jgi:hypothetical protein